MAIVPANKLFLAVVAAALVAFGIIFLKPGGQPGLLEPPPPGEDFMDVVMGGVSHSALKDGVLQWSLTAGGASFSMEQEKAFLTGVNATFFAKDGQEIFINAQKGAINTKSQGVSLEDEVILSDKDYALKSQQMDYDNDSRLIVAPAPVDMSGPRLHITGESLSYDLDRSIVTVTGNVKGQFFDLRPDS
ncbi:MAG: LPS export ABC transporter periplasmic protein LptC [Desulfatibacillaceae bacterium]|nr:LPS export ABC transporter periplasmic protein LptC [Desulfatibacillaceae bacterium]